jgi:hypothetical protein
MTKIMTDRNELDALVELAGKWDALAETARLMTHYSQAVSLEDCADELRAALLASNGPPTFSARYFKRKWESVEAELAALRARIAEAPVGWYDSTAGQVFMDSDHKPLCAAGICDVRLLLETPSAEDGRLSQPHLPEMRQAGDGFKRILKRLDEAIDAAMQSEVK